MLPALHIFSIILFPCMWISGITINSSVLAVYLGDWRKGISPGLVEKILLTMAFTNVVLQNVMTFGRIMDILQTHVRSPRALIIADFLLTYSIIYIQLSHTLCLSIFYCLRIVRFAHPLFIRLQMSLSSSIPRLILATTFTSIAINIPFIWNMDFPDQIPFNRSAGEKSIEFNVSFLVCNLVFGCFLPYLLTLVFFGLSLSSLLSHMQRMKKNMSQVRAPQLKGHITAAKTLGLRLFMDSTLFFLFIFSFIKNGGFGETFIYTIMTVYPSALSIILILGNPKLKRRLCVTWRLSNKTQEDEDK